MNDGWIKLWRKLLKSSIFGHEGMLKLWILCLLKANHEEAEVLFPGLLSPIKLMPGQFITGRNALHYDYHQGEKNKRYHRKLKPVPKTLFCWLDEMQKIQNLYIKKTNKCSMITINNWCEHQANVQQACISTDNKSAQTRRTKKNKNKHSVCFSAEQLYDFYKKHLKSGQRQGAISNITKLLKHHSEEDLSKAVLNYKNDTAGRDKRYLKDPANFFGIKEPFYKDYLPENFEGNQPDQTSPPATKEITLENIGSLYEN
jgi:hypothetical protein